MAHAFNKLILSLTRSKPGTWILIPGLLFPDCVILGKLFVALHLSSLSRSYFRGYYGIESI